MAYDAIVDAPLHEGPGHHPHLTKTETGCHVWRGSTYGPCYAHGTVGCCLIAHRSPAARRAYGQARCGTCGHFMPKDRFYEEFCSACVPCPTSTPRQDGGA